MTQEDQKFMNRFSMVIASMSVYTLFLIFLANSIYDAHATSTAPTKGGTIEDRIRPVGQVYVGEAGKAALAEQAAEQSTDQASATVNNTVNTAVSEANTAVSETADQAAEVVSDATAAVEAAAETVADAFDAAATYPMACFACHGTGAAGAPMLTDKAAWEPRIAKGTDMLYASAINGLNAMPAKGGQVQLSDDQIKALVDYMLGQVQ